MMTPYEADRLFEADTARVHQFTPGVYHCCSGEESPNEFSWRLWIATKLGMVQPVRQNEPVIDKKTR